MLRASRKFSEEENKEYSKRGRNCVSVPG